MSAFREMVLIPFEEYKRTRRQLLMTASEGEPTMQNELIQLKELHGDKLPADQYQKLESDIIQRHTYKTGDEPPYLTPAPIEVDDDSIVASGILSFSKGNIHKAKNIYEHLKSTRKQWDETGRFYTSNMELIPNSSIIELINYYTAAMQPKGTAPSGIQEFNDLLEKTNVPMNWLSNRGRVTFEKHKQNKEQIADDDAGEENQLNWTSYD